MVGRTPANIIAVRPLKDGVISDFDVTEQMLAYFIGKVHSQLGLIPRPRVVIGIPSGVTEVEKMAVHDAARNAGAREAHLIEEPMAAAIGAGLPVTDATGSMIVDIGGGTTEVAVISSVEIREAISGSVTQIVEAVRTTIEETPPELVSDLMAQGIALAGGGALLAGLEERLAHETKMRVYRADDPLTCVARGAGEALEE